MAIRDILSDEKESYSCAELARALGRHPNTVRKYEGWGFVGAVPREANGYRRYTRKLALQALFSVTALRTGFQDWEGRTRMKGAIASVVAGEYAGAKGALLAHRAQMKGQLERAIEAKRILEAWKGERDSGKDDEGTNGAACLRGEAARRIGVAPDTLRDWERNGLVAPGRLPNGRRVYSQSDMERLVVARTLRQAGYSILGLVSLFGGKTAIEDLTFARDRWDVTLRGLLRDAVLLDEIVCELESITED
jgi:DNA-binding transcriptional MerR regulator